MTQTQMCKQLAIAEISCNIPARDGNTCMLRRPAPIPQFNQKKIAGDWISEAVHPSEIAEKVTAIRLSISGQTVKNCCAKVDRPHENTPAQRLLASLLIDVLSFPQKPDRYLLAARIQDALLLSGYHALQLYYLVNNSHKRREHLACACPDRKAVEAVCIAACGTFAVGPFTSVLRKA